MARRTPRIYISHANRDEPLARNLAKAMSAHALDAWWTGRIEPGENWLRAAARALDEADALVWLCSPEWASSPFVDYEIEIALMGSRFAQRVFPIVVRPGAQFPWVLRKLQLADLSHSRATPARLEHLAAEVARRLGSAGASEPRPHFAVASKA